LASILLKDNLKDFIQSTEIKDDISITGEKINTIVEKTFCSKVDGLTGV
jgi:hypothetical protein